MRVLLFPVLWVMPQILVAVQVQQAHRTVAKWTDLSLGDEASSTQGGSQRGWPT